ncbi:MAG: recombinase family protein, partial [Oscillospiraceae bacterium]|nr:recombinase family protein [Oscillospiraceae bacterium]
MAIQVTAIPATVNRFTADPIETAKRRRAAAYARVSTDHEDQLTSYEAQVEYYTEYISGDPELEFVGIYTDEGISGTSTTRREGFKQMIADALDGKIDLIITKSVSRFARNTVDSLTAIRQLKEHGVECYFEKENIRTFDSKGELLLTIMASLAQEESRSISENCVWGQRRRFADGKVTVPFKRFLGYDRGPDGGLVVNEKEAEIVREIYRLFLSGVSPHTIAKQFTERKIPSPGGQIKWYKGTVTSILSNEKYKGDALLQKVYTTDYLTKRKKVNEGEVPQYYVEGSHEAIISAEDFARARAELDRRRKVGKPRSDDIYTSRLVCGECGKQYGFKVWCSTNRYRRVIRLCPGDGERKCSTPHLVEEEIRLVFVRAVNGLIADGKWVREPLTGFDEALWLETVDHITVFDKSDIRVSFKDGKETVVRIEEGLDYGNG